jgi:MFS family permease
VFLLVRRALPATTHELQASPVRIDIAGTFLLALTLGAYTLAMTIGHGSFGLLNISLLLAALAGAGLFVWIEARSASPLIRLAMFRDMSLSTSLAMSMVVSTVMMATLVVGPFYLSLGLGLNLALVGAVMSLGPIIAAFSGVPSGRLVDRLGSSLTVIVGLTTMAFGCIGLATLPAVFGVAGYGAALAVLTAGYALFQAANNTSVMLDVSSSQRGVVSGLLSLSRNLGLITGASAMGAVFAFVVGTGDIATAPADAIVRGLQQTFVIATVLIILTLAIAIGSGIVQRPNLLTRRMSQ